MRTPRSVRLTAPAKVNLSLDVLHRRSDGFHEIRTVFQAVDFADELEVSLGGDGVELDVSGAELGPVRENLAHRAARAFLERPGGCALGRHGVRIGLSKRIPAGAGLGGGSSDAAAVLRALRALDPEPPDAAVLCEIAAGLGSDVGFFLGSSPLARGSGRGERVTRLEPLPPVSLVLVLPPVHVSTAEAYASLARLRSEAATEARVTAAADDAPLPSSWTEVARTLHNDFEAVVPRSHPEIARSLDALREAGAQGALLSGSGAASFGIFPSPAEARQAGRAVRERLGYRVEVVHTLEAMPSVGTDGSG